MTPHIFTNLEFFLGLPVLLLLLGLTRYAAGRLFKLTLLAANVSLLVVMPNVSVRYVSFVLVVATAGYAATILLRRDWTKARKRLLSAPLILMLAAAFAALKYDFWHGLDEPVLDAALSLVDRGLLPALGFAYIAVKVYSSIIDARSGRLHGDSYLDYLLYITHFPAFLAGPIERFGAFSRTVNDAAGSKSLLPTAETSVPRFMFGVAKTFLVAPLILPYALPSIADGKLDNAAVIYLGYVAYYFYEYVNFSGYSDMSISTTRMLGMQASENFNYPFMATSLTNLWRRWHMTLAAWLRDYIFYPLMFTIMSVIGHDRPGKKALAAAAAIFVTFVICGLWHGDSYGLLFFGCFSGLVLAAEVTIEIFFKTRVTRWLENRSGLRLGYAVGSRLWAFHVACFSFGPVLLTNEQTVRLFKALGGWILSTPAS